MVTDSLKKMEQLGWQGIILFDGGLTYKAMHKIQTMLLLLVSLWSLVGCRDASPLQPQSGGKPYDVLVVNDRSNVVSKALQFDVMGLPQPEPSFDVSTVDSAHFEANLRLARCIVMVNVDSVAFPSPRIRYERDVWARPQIVVYVGAPSVQTLLGGKGQQARSLRQLLMRFEMNVEIGRLQHHRNVKAEQLLHKTFGAKLLIPEEMTSSKVGENFLWLSNNSPTVMCNVVVYKLPSSVTPSISRFIALRDSALGCNIKGENDNMQMHTAGQTVVRSSSVLRGRPTTIFRGLWEMEGDDMGGPFVARVEGNLCVESFVFAPGKSKRNTIRRLEAVLYTLNEPLVNSREK
ncbi:MAG: DUF4837 family protein [Prevotella sp.]|jgi:hypothetical protein